MKNTSERPIRAAIVVAYFLALAACASGAGPADVAPDESDTATEGVSKVDLLWVIDDSTSMCEEQNALVRAAPAFFSRLGAAGLDLRVAVTTTDVLTEGYRGAFRHQPATGHAVGCVVSVPRQCGFDARCADLAAEHPGAWACVHGNLDEALVLNDNGTVSSACELGCSSDADCEGALGATYRCSLREGAGVGCVEPPQVLDCPAELPTVLDGSNLDLFRCTAAVGTRSTQPTQPGGLRAGVLALGRPDDPCRSTTVNMCDLVSGDALEAKRAWAATERDKVASARSAATDAARRAQLAAYDDYLAACQATLAGCTAFIDPDEPNFLRPDAALVVIFVTSRDDCTREQEGAFIDETGPCSVFLAPVKDLVSAYRALKDDAAKVFAVGLVGDPAISGHDAALLPDECTRVRQIDACACPAEGGDVAACADDLGWRLACLDACLGSSDVSPNRKCSKLVPDACRCYDHDANGVAVNVDTPECQAALADEPAYRVACQRACYLGVVKTTAVQPRPYPILCSGDYGPARYGSRYVDLIQSFGDHGILGSVCSPDGFAGVLDDVASRLMPVLGVPGPGVTALHP